VSPTPWRDVTSFGGQGAWGGCGGGPPLETRWAQAEAEQRQPGAQQRDPQPPQVLERVLMALVVVYRLTKRQGLCVGQRAQTSPRPDSRWRRRLSSRPVVHRRRAPPHEQRGSAVTRAL